MKRTLLGIIAVLLSLSVSAQYDKDVRPFNFGREDKIDEQDTMMAGAYRVENEEQLVVLIMQFAESKGQKEKMYAVKRQIAALMVDGKLHNYEEIRNFRHGRAAVAIREKTKNGSRLIWGFVDKQMKLVVPLKYTKVYDFNNANFRKHNVYDPMEDEDSKGWTTVIDKEYQMGMIDRDGNVKIPCMFTEDEHHKVKIKFIPTPWGEYAGVYRSQENKEGIIDRNGNYTLPPTYSHLVWYKDLQCFGTIGDNRIYFDHKGNRLSK